MLRPSERTYLEREYNEEKVVYLDDPIRGLPPLEPDEFEDEEVEEFYDDDEEEHDEESIR